MSDRHRVPPTIRPPRRWAAFRLPLRAALLTAAMLLASALAGAGEARPTAPDPALEARMLEITTELRCLVCQNQTVADSHSGLAEDLRQQVLEQLAAGRSRDEVLRFMTDRYGDFVLYRPPLRATTLLLWAGPFALLALGLLALAITLMRRQRLADSAFDPETSDDPDAPASPRAPSAARVDDVSPPPERA